MRYGHSWHQGRSLLPELRPRTGPALRRYAAQERKSKPDSEFLRALPEHSQTYEEAQAYAPNKTYIGAMSIDELEKAPAPWIDNLGTPERFGSFGEIMPEDEFLGLMDICDVFDLIWLEEGFAASVAEKLAQNPVIGEKQLARLEKGRPESDILDVVEKQHALPLYSEGRLAGLLPPRSRYGRKPRSRHHAGKLVL